MLRAYDIKMNSEGLLGRSGNYEQEREREGESGRRNVEQKALSTACWRVEGWTEEVNLEAPYQRARAQQ